MKKWTFLVASAILVGATPVFTGCIDNDEPEGISVLRGAKAELLRAKASVEAAKVAQIQADAALTLAQAEIQKAEAARIKAIADYESAKALEMQYKAELQNIKNEEQRADLENKIKIYAEQRAAAEREAQEAAAKLEISLAYLKTELTKQQAAYEIALKDLALAKTTLTDKQNSYLKPWSDALGTAKSNVDQAATTLERKANLLAYAIRELDKTKAQESLFVEAKYQVQETSATWEAKKKAEAVAEQATKKEITATKWDEERIKLEAQKEAADKKWSQANTKKIDLANQDATKALAAKTNELKAAYEAMAGVWNENGYWDKESTEEFEFDPIKIQINDPVLPENPYVYAPDESNLKYKYSDYLNAVKNNEKLPIIRRLDYEIEKVKAWGVDENGKAYTAQSILDYQQELARLTAQSKSYRNQWNNAVAVYLNSDKIKEMDGYTALEAKSDEYNKAADLYNKAVAAYYGFMNENDAIDKEYRAGVNEITKKEEAALAVNTAAFDKKMAEIKDNVTNLRKVHETKTAVKNKCFDEYQQDPTDAKKTAFEAALAQAKTAETALTNALTAQPNLEKAANDQKAKQDVLTMDTYAVELAKYDEAYYKEHPNEAIQIKLDALRDDKSKAENVYSSVRIGFKNTCVDFYSNAGLENYFQGVDFPSNTIKFGDSSVTEYLPLDLAKSIGVDRTDLKNYEIAQASSILFGTSDLIRFKDSDGQWTYIQLGELTPARIKELLDKEYVKNYDSDAESAPYSYILYRCKEYADFGYVGRMMACELQIEQAKAYIENDGKAVKALLAQLEAVKTKVEAQIEANTATVEAAEEAYTKSQEEYDALFTEVQKELATATAEKLALEPVISSIEQAIEKYLSYEEANIATDEKKAKTVEEFKKALATAYTNAKEATKNAEYAYHVAVETLAKVTAGKEEFVAFAQKGWDDAKAKLEAAQKELEAANDALQAEIERISTVE